MLAHFYEGCYFSTFCYRFYNPIFIFHHFQSHIFLFLLNSVVNHHCFYQIHIWPKIKYMKGIWSTFGKNSRCCSSDYFKDIFSSLGFENSLCFDCFERTRWTKFALTIFEFSIWQQDVQCGLWFVHDSASPPFVLLLMIFLTTPYGDRWILVQGNHTYGFMDLNHWNISYKVTWNLKFTLLSSQKFVLLVKSDNWCISNRNGAGCLWRGSAVKDENVKYIKYNEKVYMYSLMIKCSYYRKFCSPCLFETKRVFKKSSKNRIFLEYFKEYSFEILPPCLPSTRHTHNLI